MDEIHSLHEIRILAPGPRPAYYLVAQNLWGIGCDFDSDGDSRTAEDQDWTELTVELRDGTGEKRVDIDSVAMGPLILAIRSSDPDLCDRAAKFIAAFSGGTVEY